MWRITAFVSLLVVAVVTTTIHGRPEQRLGSSTSHARQAEAQPGVGRSCWKRILRDWVDDGRIDGRYPRLCYELALNHIPEEGRQALYGSGTQLISALEQGAGSH